MKVLVATRETQGLRSSDYSWTVEGELVKLPMGRCTVGSVDDDCGCRRGLSGVASSLSTTTAMVVSRPDLTPELYTALVRESYRREGWCADDEPDGGEWVDEVARTMLVVAAFLPAGSVVEYRDDEFAARPTPRRARAA